MKEGEVDEMIFIWRERSAKVREVGTLLEPRPTNKKLLLLLLPSPLPLFSSSPFLPLLHVLLSFLSLRSSLRE